MMPHWQYERRWDDRADELPFGPACTEPGFSEDGGVDGTRAHSQAAKADCDVPEDVEPANKSERSELGLAERVGSTTCRGPTQLASRTDSYCFA